jgi:hypothetical protein
MRAGKALRGLDMPFLYSTNTYLAYSISEQYYDQKHYFWCAPHFDGRSISPLVTPQPPTSSPAELYEGFAADIQRGDLHSSRVGQNRTGIIAGATQHKLHGRITGRQFNEIVEIVRAAQLQDFRPLLFIADLDGLKKNLKLVPVTKRAHPLSREYVAQRVKRTAFDVIELPRSF